MQSACRLTLPAIPTTRHLVRIQHPLAVHAATRSRSTSPVSTLTGGVSGVLFQDHPPQHRNRLDVAGWCGAI